MPSWTLLIEPISHLIDKLIPDPLAAAKVKAALRNAEHEQDLKAIELALQASEQQTRINVEEAKNISLFVAGWRPFIGWVCGAAFAYHFIIQPLLVFLLNASGNPLQPPQFEMDTLSTVLMGMLGLGSLRTIEKMRGV